MPGQELLAAIGEMLDKKLEPMKQDITWLRQDVSGLKEQVTGLQKQNDQIAQGVMTTRDDLRKLYKNQDALSSGISQIQSHTPTGKSFSNEIWIRRSKTRALAIQTGGLDI